jgi:hypothetical protein
LWFISRATLREKAKQIVRYQKASQSKEGVTYQVSVPKKVGLGSKKAVFSDDLYTLEALDEMIDKYCADTESLFAPRSKAPKTNGFNKKALK